MTLAFSRRALIWAAAAAFAALAGTAVVSASAQDLNTPAPDLRQSLLLFPTDINATGVPVKDELVDLLTDVAASRLSASGAYSVFRFSRGLPAVARLHMEQLLTDADVAPPFSEDNRKPIRIAKEASYDNVFVGSLDSYEYKEAEREVAMVLSGRLIHSQTGNVTKTAIINVNVKGAAGAKEEDVALQAARQAGEQLMTRIVPTIARQATPDTPTKPVAEPTTRKRGRMDWLWGVLAVGLGLGIGLSSSKGGGGGSSGGGGGGGDNPPPPPG